MRIFHFRWTKYFTSVVPILKLPISSILLSTMIMKCPSIKWLRWVLMFGFAYFYLCVNMQKVYLNYFCNLVEFLIPNLLAYSDFSKIQILFIPVLSVTHNKSIFCTFPNNVIFESLSVFCFVTRLSPSLHRFVTSSPQYCHAIHLNH